MTRIKLKSPIFCLLLVLSLLTLPGIAAGLDVETDVKMIGEGVIDHEAGVNTEVGFSGIKYTEYFYTKSVGYYNIYNISKSSGYYNIYNIYNLSTVDYSSYLDLKARDSLNTTLEVDCDHLVLSNIRQMACLRHYNLACLPHYDHKSRQSFKTEGDTKAYYTFSADNCSASIYLNQTLEGSGGYYLLVRNSTDMHTKEYLDRSEYMGDYELIEVDNYVGCDGYPGAGLDGDWLPCPFGPT